MFSLLNPITPWLLLLVGVPIIIHFIGKMRVTTIKFPSLLLLQNLFVQAASRQRLKNILLLILRTLLILSLLAALLFPVIKIMGPELALNKSIMVIHNGAWGNMVRQDGKSLLEWQMEIAAKIDSLSSRELVKVPFFKYPLRPGPNQNTEMRYGNYDDVFKNLLELLELKKGAYSSIYIPLFRQEDAQTITTNLNLIQELFPHLGINILDFTPHPPLNLIYKDLSINPDLKKPILNMDVTLHHAISMFKPHKLQLFINGSLLKELPHTGDSDLDNVYSFSIQYSEGVPITGWFNLVTSGINHPFARYHFYINVPAKRNALHLGGTLTTLPSLGRSDLLTAVEHYNFIEELPNLNQYHLIMISNFPAKGEKFYPQLLQYIRGGGTLVICTGANNDVNKINTQLLEPLSFGYLGNNVDTDIPDNGIAADESQKLKFDGSFYRENRVDFRGLVPETYIKRQMAFTPGEGTSTILSSSKGPLLSYKEYQGGSVYLWSSDLDNPAWSGLGTTAFVPVFHQWLLSKWRGNKWFNDMVCSDSTYQYPTLVNQSSVTVKDPQMANFRRLEENYDHIKIGPFNKLGLYQIMSPQNSQAFAVNICSFTPQEPQTRDNVLLPTENKTVNTVNYINPEDLILQANEGYYSIWKLCILLAILLLLLEGCISYFLMRRSQVISK